MQAFLYSNEINKNRTALSKSGFLNPALSG